MAGLVPAIVALGLVALAALLATLGRTSPVELAAERAAVSKMLAIATAVQTAHFIEEWATGFNVRFPALFGLGPIPLSVFVAFNLTWIILWIASIPLIRKARQAAFFTAWFLAIAGVLNGIAHPVLAIRTGGYFPGLISSPVIGLAGLLLWQRLGVATSASGARG